MTRLLTCSPQRAIFDRAQGCPQLLCRELRAVDHHRPSSAAGGARAAGHRLWEQTRPSRRRRHHAEHVSSTDASARSRQGVRRRRSSRHRADGDPRPAEACWRRRRGRAHPARAWAPPAASAQRISKSPHPRVTALLSACTLVRASSTDPRRKRPPTLTLLGLNEGCELCELGRARSSNPHDRYETCQSRNGRTSQTRTLPSPHP